MRTVAAVILVFFGVACGPSGDTGENGPMSPGVDLSVQPDRAEAGSSIVLGLSNESNEPVGYNLCTSALERWEAGDWTTVPSERVCTMELRTLEPGRTAQYDFELPDDLQGGEYRVHTTVHVLDAGTQETVRSERFRVD